MSLPTADWVALSPRFTPGWPWPENSYGLGPMYGDDGWCRECGTPTKAQTGPLVIQGTKFPDAEVWMPNWLFDVVCVSAQVAEQIKDDFVVQLGGVHKPRTGPTGVHQILPTLSLEPWHRPDDLAQAVIARHHQHSGNQTGTSCTGCGRWKWLPVSEHEVPVLASAMDSASDVIASAEHFGDGLSSFRHLLFRRALGEALVTASPRNWDLVEVLAI